MQNPALDAQHPWPGLAAYDEAGAPFFKGRDPEALQLLQLVKLAPVVALYGRSGLGKSSLLRAGLFPRLREAGYLPVYIRLDHRADAASVLEQIALCLEAEISARQLHAPPRAPGESLWHWLHRKDFELWTADNWPRIPVLVLDQFEELFAHASGARLQGVLAALADLVENRLSAEVAGQRDALQGLDSLSQRYRLLFSFREDYLPELRAWAQHVPSLLRHELRLEPMRAERAEQAVAEAGGALLAPGAAAAIARFVGEQSAGQGHDAVEPVLLSLTCAQLAARRQGALVDQALLDSIGHDILEGYYRDALAGQPESLHRFIEDHLLQGSRTRGSYAKAEALAQGFITEAQLEALTSQWRLLRVESLGHVDRIELIHDRLVDVVRLARDRRVAQQAAEQARAEQLRLAELENAQRLRRRSQLALLMAALAGGTAIWAVSKKEALETSIANEAKAKREAEAAEAQRQSLQAEAERKRLAEQQARRAEYGWIAEPADAGEQARLQRVSDQAHQAIKRIDQSTTPADVERRRATTVEVWTKELDETRVKVGLFTLGFQVVSRAGRVTDIATNIVWYGQAAAREDVQLVALALLRSGVQLRAVRPMPVELARSRSAWIQVGADHGVQERAPLAVEAVASGSGIET
ncbi:hypothetical protein PFX98_02840 [Paucibacter sediminis]|uniref:Novel STAND NTPase 1 domain-containing protein n=1 Tax=Paucibacter sediminis TaxID=3019553 RepID=A0AA95SQY9_9BURK|nr:hypothetical protein [Paucibacter sp. S2-9]WIT12561.1 hypothetical protein PFX98_02840 [Paucibacter sp. S2-9]